MPSEMTFTRRLSSDRRPLTRAKSEAPPQIAGGNGTALAPGGGKPRSRDEAGSMEGPTGGAEVSMGPNGGVVAPKTVGLSGCSIGSCVTGVSGNTGANDGSNAGPYPGGITSPPPPPEVGSAGVHDGGAVGSF